MFRRPGPLTVLAGVLVLVLLAWLSPWTRARITAVASVADGLGVSAWRPFAPSVRVRDVTAGGIPVDVYEPTREVPSVVLVPGAVPGGRDDPRVRQLATALARSDRRVVVPELSVYREELVTDDVERLVDLTLALSAEGAEVVLLGISFGGSLSLVAAADDRLDGRLAGVATFGAYADLVGVVQAATTGVSLVEGRALAWVPDPRAEEVVRDELVSLLPAPEADALRGALDRGDPKGLPSDARAVYRLLANDDPERTYRLAASLPSRIRDRLAAVSPTAVVDGLSGTPVVAMHSRDDPVIPYGELLRLGVALPDARLLTVESLEHADLELTAPSGWAGTVDDLATIWSFTAAVLRWQEPSWPWGPG